MVTVKYETFDPYDKKWNKKEITFYFIEIAKEFKEELISLLGDYVFFK